MREQYTRPPTAVKSKVIHSQSYPQAVGRLSAWEWVRGCSLRARL